MGYTYHTKTNCLCVCSYTGITIERTYQLVDQKSDKPYPHPNVDWKKGSLYLSDMSRNKAYQVWIANNGDTDEFPFLIKVAEPYHDCVFEQFFRLGSHCANYCDLTTVAVVRKQPGTVLVIPE